MPCSVSSFLLQKATTNLIFSAFFPSCIPPSVSQLQLCVRRRGAKGDGDGSGEGYDDDDERDLVDNGLTHFDRAGKKGGPKTKSEIRREAGKTGAVMANALEEAAVVANKLKSQMKNRAADDAAFLPYHERRQMQISPGRLSDVISPESRRGDDDDDGDEFRGGGRGGGRGRGGDDFENDALPFPAGDKSRRNRHRHGHGNPTPEHLRDFLTFTVEERHWYDAKKWIVWRWCFEITRMVGIVLLIGKLIPSAGPIGALKNASWGVILIPWFALDAIVVAGIVIGWRSFYVRYFSEASSLMIYTLFLGQLKSTTKTPISDLVSRPPLDAVACCPLLLLTRALLMTSSHSKGFLWGPSRRSALSSSLRIPPLA